MVTWNDQADAKVSRQLLLAHPQQTLTEHPQLLVSVLHTSTPKIDYAAVAKLMGKGVSVAEHSSLPFLLWNQLTIYTRCDYLCDQASYSASEGQSRRPGRWFSQITGQVPRKEARPSYQGQG